MKNAYRSTARISLYRKNGKVTTIQISDDWTILSLSHYYPVCSKTGFDSLLYAVPEKERDDVTIVFYDSNNNPTADPRRFMEDLEG